MYIFLVLLPSLGCFLEVIPLRKLFHLYRQCLISEFQQIRHIQTSTFLKKRFLSYSQPFYFLHQFINRCITILFQKIVRAKPFQSIQNPFVYQCFLSLVASMWQPTRIIHLYTLDFEVRKHEHTAHFWYCVFHNISTP